jgi:hypothetical protein
VDNFGRASGRYRTLLVMTDALGDRLRDDADLHALWCTLMGPDTFAWRTLWLMFLDAEDRPRKVLVPIDHVPDEPDTSSLQSLDHMIREATADVGGGSVPLLISRPGAPAMDDRDRRWAAALVGELGHHLGRWPVHLATHGVVRVFAPDDLIAAARR